MMSASNELDFDFDDFDAPMAADVSLDELLKRFLWFRGFNIER